MTDFYFKPEPDAPKYHYHNQYLFYNGLVEKSEPILFSRPINPEEFHKVWSIKVGHPAIARFLAKYLNKLLKWWNR